MYPGGLPLAQMKQGQVLSAENLLGAPMEHGGVCLNTAKQNGGNRNGGASPKKLTPVNGNATPTGRAM